jgi:hypothetical protein
LFNVREISGVIINGGLVLGRIDTVLSTSICLPISGFFDEEHFSDIVEEGSPNSDTADCMVVATELVSVVSGF